MSATAATRRTFDPNALGSFLDVLIDPSRGCTEIRIPDGNVDPQSLRVVSHDTFKSTISTWGDDSKLLIREAARIRGIPAFITVNPVNPALKARADRLIKSKATTTDNDIMELRFLFIDLDAKRPTGISSTNEELQAALARLWKLHADHPELAQSAIWGCSGNGYWMLVLLPGYPNDDEHRALIAKATDWLSARYSDDLVEIDPATKNPARVMPLVGTMKCKGVSTADRPHRMVTIESPPGRQLPPLDLVAWAALHIPAENPPSIATNGHAGSSFATKAPSSNGDIEKRVIAYLAPIEASVSGQNGSGKTFGAVCRIGPGFDLTEDDTVTYITAHYNPRCIPPWSDKEIRHKVSDAFKKSKKPRGFLLNSKTKQSKVLSYSEENGCLFTGNERLANFTARIKQTVIRHEAGAERVRFKIEVKHAAGHRRSTAVDAEKYSTMAWVYGLGAEFAMDPGREVKDLVRHAVQVLSQADGIRRAVEHTSLGWIRHEGEWLYLHAGGAIGTNVPFGGVGVEIPGTLGKYSLPVPPADTRILVRAMDAHLEVWGLAKPGRQGGRGAAAIAGVMPWRSPLSAFDAYSHLGGPSGNFKTAVARIILQHFSADAKGRNCAMPADWRSTVNALQRLAFDCRDSLLIIDDLKLEKQLEVAEIVFQTQGNLQGRLRMNFDQSMHQGLDPRGSILSTGEIDPRSTSTLGRGLAVELKEGDIDAAILSKLQQAGDEGLFALLMAAYIQWLAPKLDSIRSEHAQLTARYRDQIVIVGAHQRHPDAIAQLIAAYELFMRFGVERGLIGQITADNYLMNAKGLLIEVGANQAGPREESKIGRRFLDLIASALQSGRCHLKNADDELTAPTFCIPCGWRWEATGPNGDWRIPGGSRCIGFDSSNNGFVYLDVNESLAIAMDMAKAQHAPQNFASVGRELLQEGLVKVHKDGDKTRASQAVRIHGSLKRCFWVPRGNLFNPQVVTTITTP
jgi:hypothetical protein